MVTNRLKKTQKTRCSNIFAKIADRNNNNKLMARNGVNNKINHTLNHKMNIFTRKERNIVKLIMAMQFKPNRELHPIILIPLHRPQESNCLYKISFNILNHLALISVNIVRTFRFLNSLGIKIVLVKRVLWMIKVIYGNSLTSLGQDHIPIQPILCIIVA